MKIIFGMVHLKLLLQYGTLTDGFGMVIYFIYYILHGHVNDDVYIFRI